ncbi:MAG: TrmB family transcriptional regulator, partial [archaeon]
MTSERDDSRLIETLEKVGLSPYQSKAYVTVLKLGSATATTIAEKSGVPESRIYDVLRDLEDEGFIEVYEQDSLRA